MWNIGKSLVTFFLMAIPLWVAVAGLCEYQPSSLTVHLDELDVRCFIDGEEYKPESGMLGPIELNPGEYQLVVVRDTRILFSYPVVVESGGRKEVWAHWKTRPREEPRGLQVQGALKA